MPSLKRYRTGLITTDYYSYRRPPYVGKAWRAKLGNPRQGRAPCGVTVWHNGQGQSRKLPEKEVIILTRSLSAAQRAADLIHAALCALRSESYLVNIGFYHEPFAYPADERPSEGLDEQTIGFLKRRSMETDGIPLACTLGAKCSFRRARVYALTKLMLSYNLQSALLVDLDPSRPNLPRSPFPSVHVKFAHSIIAAYGAIEELGLEVRASERNPSKIDGKWNPKVKADLEDRLKRAGIDISQPFLWVCRGAKTSLERVRPPEGGSRAEWSYGDVRDVHRPLIDAINDVAWFRSRIAAHRMPKLAGLLSGYDVANAQSLATRLLLEKLGFWRPVESG